VRRRTSLALTASTGSGSQRPHGASHRVARADRRRGPKRRATPPDPGAARPR